VSLTSDDDSDSTGTPDDGSSGGAAPGNEANSGDVEAGDDGLDPDDGTGPREGPTGREIVVPMSIYKVVTVMATLLAMVGVVGGFVLLDAATNRANAPIDEVNPVVALFGLAFIVAGAAVYAFSTRFRAEGMGKSKTDEGQHRDDG
jgi:hypothetical protein